VATPARGVLYGALLLQGACSAELPLQQQQQQQQQAQLQQQKGAAGSSGAQQG